MFTAKISKNHLWACTGDVKGRAMVWDIEAGVMRREMACGAPVRMYLEPTSSNELDYLMDAI